MKNFVLFFISLLLSITGLAQSFQIGHATITLTDPSRNNRNIVTEVYYPADVTGDNVPVTTVTGDKFPLIGFGHGFVMTWDAYENIWQALVPDGYIIAFPKTEGSIVPSHLEFGKDLAFVISDLTNLDTDSTSWLYNRVDTMNCVMGHSMGGGAAFIAAELSAGIKAIATLAPAETNPSAIQAAAGIFIPSLIIAGGNDCVTPPVSNQVPMYDSLQGNCKTYISINGGSHCQMAENNFLCSFGEATCSPQPAITRSEQHVVINRYLIPWLEYSLKGNCMAGAQFDSLIVADTTITFQKTCTLCTTSFLNDNEANLLAEPFPNPFSDKLYLRLNKLYDNVIVDLYSINGNVIFSKKFSDKELESKSALIINEHFAPGMYLLKITSGDHQLYRKVIKY